MKNDDKNKLTHAQQENCLSEQSKAFLQMLQSRGIVADQDISNERIREAEKEKKRAMFHNTQVLLQNYRDIVWALECIPVDVAEELDKPLRDLDSLLSLVSAEIGMDNTKLENRLKSIQKSRLLLDRFNEALTMLKQKPVNGKLMYNIIYQTYLIPEKLTHTEILYRVNISTRHYYRLRQQAINIISIRLWAAPAGELDSWLEVLTLLENLE